MEQLSKSEKQIMDTFWNSPQPLPASDLLSACVGRTWKARSVFPLVKKLIEKGALAEVGCVRRGKTYARTFQPTLLGRDYKARRYGWRSTFGVDRSSCTAQAFIGFGMYFQDCEKEVTNNGMYTVCLSIMWGTNVLCARNKSHNIRHVAFL